MRDNSALSETNLLSGREFRSLEHLNEVTAWWLKEVADVRVHRQTKQRPIDLHAEELPHLIPLPERPYEVAEVVYRTVDAEGIIPYAQNRYSVPWQYIGQVLPVRIRDDEIIIYGPRLEPLACHLRFPPTSRHQQSRQAGHLPPRDLQQRARPSASDSRQLGSMAVRFLEGLLDTQRCGWDHAQKILALLGTYHRERSSSRFGACRALRGILREIGGTHPGGPGPPKTCWDRMAEEDRPALKNYYPINPLRRDPRRTTNNCLFEESDQWRCPKRARRRRRKRQRRTKAFVSGFWKTPKP